MKIIFVFSSTSPCNSPKAPYTPTNELSQCPKNWANSMKFGLDDEKNPKTNQNFIALVKNMLE